MVRLVLVFLILTGSIYAGLHMQSPGYVLIAINGWTLETSVWFALFALLLIFLIFHGLLVLIHKPALWQERYERWQEKRQTQKSLADLRAREYLMFQQNLTLSTLKDLEKSGSKEAVDSFFAKMSRKFRNTPQIREEYIHYLILSAQTEKAEKILRKALKKNPQDMGLIDLYGRCAHNSKQITFAESLLSKNEPSAVLYLCLGRLCMHQQLWGKAKNYLEKSLALHATPEAYQELARLFESIQDQENAYVNYKEGLKLV